MIIRIDSNFNIIDKIDEPDDKLIIATEIGVKKLKFYYEMIVLIMLLISHLREQTIWLLVGLM